MQGWIKLHRSIMCSDTFSRLNAIQKLIAIYIILDANHEDGIWYDKYKNLEVDIKRGQTVVSRSKIVNEWFAGDKEVTERKARTALSKLEKVGFLTSEATNNYTILTVLNYNVYQQSENKSDQVVDHEATKGRPRDDQETSLNKNVKNVKNDKNEKKKNIYAEFVSLTSEEYEKLIADFGQAGTDDRIERLNLYKGSTGKKYKSDYLTILNWEKKNQKGGGNGGTNQSATDFAKEYNLGF